jgi:hypothetical protein
VKTQILQLETHDDVISTRDKMSWGQTGRILLILPPRGRILTRRLDLVLLKRRSAEIGAQLALVTRDPLVRFHAHVLGLPIFDNVTQAQHARWKRRRLTRQRSPASLRSVSPASPPLASPVLQPSSLPAASLLRLTSPVLRIILFTLGLLAFLAVAAIFIPQAEITLTPESITQQMVLEVEGSADEGVSVVGLVPIRQINVVVEGRDSLTPSGEVQIPDASARGEVVFTNLTDKPVAIPAGTVVSPRGALVRFATERNGEAPAGPGQTLTLPVVALTPGSAGNLPADRIQEIHGALGLYLSVVNPEPISGGNNRPGLFPTPLDRTRLRNRLLPRLQDSALVEIQSRLEPGDLLLTPSPLLSRTLAETFEPGSAQPANVLSLQLRLDFQASVILSEDLELLATTVLDATLPPNYLPQASTLTIEHLTIPQQKSDAVVKWKMRIQRTIQPQITASQATNLAVGLSPTQAGQRLQAALPLDNSPRITLEPAWWPRLPLLPFRIQVYAYPGN